MTHKIIYYFFVIVFLCACSPQMVQVSGVVPARIQFDPPIKKVLVFNHYLPVDGNEILDESRVRRAEVFAEASKMACLSVINALNEQKKIEGVFLDTLYRAAKTNAVLKKNQLIGLAKQYQADAIVVLDALEISVENDIVRTTNETGQEIKVSNVYADTQTDWILWDAESGELLDTKQYKDRDLHRSKEVQSGLLSQITGPDIPAARKTIVEQATRQGRYHSGTFSTLNYQTSRMMMNEKSFENAKKMMLSRRFQAAITELDQFAQSETTRIAAKALYNKAICYEALGNISEAYLQLIKAKAFNKETSFAFLELYQQEIDIYMEELGKFLGK